MSSCVNWENCSEKVRWVGNDSEEEGWDERAAKGAEERVGSLMGLPISIRPCLWYLLTILRKDLVISDHRKTLMSFSMLRVFGCA